MVRMKALARSYVWWPGLDDDIVQEVRDCLNCQQTQRQSPSAALHPWKWCMRPFQRVHIDFAGKDGKNYFVAVDSFSKWPEIAVMNTTNTESDFRAFWPAGRNCFRQQSAIYFRIICHISTKEWSEAY
ncbi:hypothetical protein RRG08_028378 [Elysia crispata]|uniref:Integrase zinc-binding domain-containing protein n=1 Tax=Elysia crispata TaxID=231223 RepID=A0AAE1B9Q0_9GAST|nr:hypothetical protein RRG08_028378 [Elysia crispata]